MIKLTECTKFYNNGNNKSVVGIDKISTTFSIGEFVVIFGQSGSGKSTLLNILSGLDFISQGNLAINNENTEYYDDLDWENYRKTLISSIRQDYNLIDHQTVHENILWAINLNHAFNKKMRSSLIREYTDLVGLRHFENKKVINLSGGEKQRVAIARALAKNTPVIIADEPTGNLDQENAEKIAKLLKEVSVGKLTIVVTHNPELFKSYATRMIELSDGKIKNDIKLQKVKENTVTSTSEASYPNTLRLILSNIFSSPGHSLHLIFSTFMILIFSFLSISVFLSLLDQNSQSISHNEIYANFNPNRVIVSKTDLTAFTELEIEAFNDNPSITRIINHDILLDTVFISKFNGQYGEFQLDFNGDTLEGIESHSKLIWGTLPINENDVILGLAKSTNVNLESSTNLSIEISSLAHSNFVVNVVGIIETDNDIGTIFFTLQKANSIIDSLMGNHKNNTVKNLENQSVVNGINILHSNQISSNKLVLTRSVATSLGIVNNDDVNVSVQLNDVYYNRAISLVNIEIISDETTVYGFVINPNERLVIISKSDYDNLLTTDSYQVSLFFNSRNDADNFIVNNDQYRVFYPFGILEYLQMNQTNNNAVIVGMICGVMIIILFFVNIFWLNNTNKNKMKKDIVLLSLGYDRKQLSLVNYLTFYIYLICAILITVLTIYISRFIFILNKNYFIPLSNLSNNLVFMMVLIICILYTTFYSRKYSVLSNKSINELLRGEL